MGKINKEVIFMNVSYIYHSGFTIETEKNYLIFDYYRGDIELKDKDTIIFCSHGHDDHFNPKILEWDNRNTNYILSDDIQVEKAENIHFMSPYEDLTINGIEVRTFGSTDLGLSFLIKLEDKTIFYAGDLNWWDWNSNSESEKIQEEKDYKEELDKIKAYDPKIDLAFVPVDPRLEENYYRAGQYFIKEFKPDYFFPMHFGDNLDVSRKFANRFKDSSTNIMVIERENQTFPL